MSEARKYRAIVVERRGNVEHVTLNRPERRNAIGPEMINELRYALDDAHAAADVRSIVLTGAGKAFCAGGDFAQMASGPDEGALPMHPDNGGDYAQLCLCMVRSGKPIVAKVNGHAMGGGLGLVAASTFAIAANTAQIGTPEVEVGLFPMMIMALLDRLVPRRRLVKMMVLGEKIGAEEAAQIGLLNEVVPPEALEGKVATLCELLGKKAPMAIRYGLHALADQDARTLGESLPILRDRLGALLGTDDAREGLTAFMEKRAPSWAGR